MKSHFDVGIVGWWANLNYGGTISYYALNKMLQKLGYSVVMVTRSGNKMDENTVPYKFAKKYYEMSEPTDYSRMYELNYNCDAFIVGSDQLWNPYLQEYSGPEYYLSFVDVDKKKIAYATSFGNIDRCDAAFIKMHKDYLDNFDAISVREDYAVDICKNDFNIDAKHVCDPVFLCNSTDYIELINEAKDELPARFILNFMLDPSPEKNALVEQIQEHLSISDRINLTDLQDIDEKVGAFEGGNTRAECDVEDFINAFFKADYIVTDSFHGTCLAVIFNKPFISVANYKRGEKRFISLLKWLCLEDRLIKDVNNIPDIKKIIAPFSYKTTNTIIQHDREMNIKWLNYELKKEIPKDRMNPEKLMRTKIEKLWNNPDFKKVRILVTLLKDYGIKHIVLSPGGRDVPLVRMVEYNNDFFQIHRIVDERSAAYYGLGIATQLQTPVACICTSGTAVSNYMPAVTEAYYTRVPLVVITADRYSVYHEQGEDQTIPQTDIFCKVVKKEITIPEGDTYYTYYQARRDISDALLESTHNVYGPVHINIGIDNIMIGSNIPKEHWKILPRINPHILRVTLNDRYDTIMRWVIDLRKSKKILVVYGQNAPCSESQKEIIEQFSRKYNCLIITDFISNYDGKYTLQPYNMLQSISNETFNNELSPDIIITVGGKRLMNDPLTFKVRGGRGDIRHWSVSPDGVIRDFYFRLTSVIEMSQEKFFEFFSENAGEIQNDGVFYEKWRKLCQMYDAPAITRFNGHYVQSRFIPAIPANSVLHLGVGQSFYDSRRYHMEKSVDVYCNMGTNGIDGCSSTFMGQCSVVHERLCFLLVGDLSFFYDMNSIWNKNLSNNVRILMVNNNGTDLLRGHALKGIVSEHNTSAKGWVESCGFKYISARTKEEYDTILPWFMSTEPDAPVFFEVFCE